MNGPVGMPEVAQDLHQDETHVHMAWLRAMFVDLFGRADALKRLVHAAHGEHDDGTSTLRIYVDRDIWRAAVTVADAPRPELATTALSERDARRLFDAITESQQ